MSEQSRASFTFPLERLCTFFFFFFFSLGSVDLQQRSACRFDFFSLFWIQHQSNPVNPQESLKIPPRLNQNAKIAQKLSSCMLKL